MQINRKRGVHFPSQYLHLYEWEMFLFYSTDILMKMLMKFIKKFNTHMNEICKNQLSLEFMQILYY